MKDPFPRRAIGGLAAVFASFLLLLCFATSAIGPAALAQSQDLPERVVAKYQIQFSALGKIGGFQFRSELKDGEYELKANAKIDTAVFDYFGTMKSSGTLAAGGIRPDQYTFRYKQDPLIGKKKARRLKMGFKNAGVESVKFVPPDPVSKRAIPVTKAQLQNVLDPLSGVMALSLGNLSNPCDRKLAIYDGKARFDLIFTPARKSSKRPDLHVCFVRYVPISGHKESDGKSHPVIDGQIEVILRSIPSANIVVPYMVTVPTIVGSAVLKSKRIDIEMPNRKRIALKD